MRSDSNRKSGIGKIVTPVLTTSETWRPSRTRDPAGGAWFITTSFGNRSLGRLATTAQRSSSRVHSATASACAWPIIAGVWMLAAFGPKNSLIERPNHTSTPTASASASAKIQS